MTHSVPSLSSTHTKREIDDEEEAKTISEERRGSTGGYPHILETAPFPALGSLEEITQTITKNSSRQASGDKVDVSEALPSEGWRNRGWLVVISTFLVNFFAFGTIYSWGNFQRLYLQDVYAGQTDDFKIAFVGTSATACLLSCGLFLTPVIQRLGYRGTMCIGTVVAPLGLILASFATELWHIYLSQGILFGIGAAFVFSTSITLPSQWFVKYRAFATGIAVSGSGVGGVALSPMSQNLIDTVGYRNALRAMGGMGFGILCIATALAFSRWKPPGDRFVIIDRSLINFHFCILLLFGLIVPFGYVAPFFLTPTYAAYINVDASRGATLVSVMSAMNAVCRIVLGFLADYIGRLNTMFIFTLIAGIFCMVIWQFATSYGSFVAYAVLYGLTGGGFVSLFPVVTADIVGVANIQRGLGMCYLATTVGNLLGTPIAGLLQKHFGWTAAIQFAGAPSVTAALVILVLRQIRSRGKIFMKI